MSAVAATSPLLSDLQCRKVLGLIGLGMRGRMIVVGVEQVRQAVMKGNVHLAVVANDASRHSQDKVMPLLKARNVDVLEWASGMELGAAVGRESTAAIGIVDQALAHGIRGAVAGAAPADDATRTSR